MTIDPAKIKEVFAKKGYKFDPLFNIVAVRTELQVPDVFNDLMVAIWTVQTMPAGLSDLDKQKWLKANFFLGKDGKELKLDGDFGANSKFAYDSYLANIGKEKIKFWTVTSDPGTYYLNNPLSKLGTAVLCPGQYIDSHQIGFHQQKKDHRALVQTGGKVKVYRDGDKDNIAEVSAVTETGSFGINVHGANKGVTTPKVGKWSAGCVVFANWIEKECFIDLCETFRKVKNNKFTLNLIEEKDLK